MSTKRMQEAFTNLALVAVLALGSAAASAAEEPTLDPVVADVVEMLEAGVADAVIIQWLDSTDRRPTDIGPAGMIALTEAGASEALVKTLLEGVETSAEKTTMEAPPGEETTVPTVEPTVPSPEAALQASAAEPGPPLKEGKVELVASLRAKRVFTDEPEPDSPPEEPWDVFVYLDGDLVAWTRPTLQGEPVEARRVINAGQRELRVVLQRYEERRGGWLHESLSVPNLVVFEARPAAPLEIEVEMRRIWGLWRQRKDGGPLRYVIRQGETILAENEGTGGDPARWQPVCEDVEANFPDSDGVPGRFRNAMSRCVRWASLWNGTGRETSRAAILAELAKHDFEPPVR